MLMYIEFNFFLKIKNNIYIKVLNLFLKQKLKLTLIFFFKILKLIIKNRINLI